MKTICKLIGSMICFYAAVYLLTDSTLRIGISIGEMNAGAEKTTIE